MGNLKCFAPPPFLKSFYVYYLEKIMLTNHVAPPWQLLKTDITLGVPMGCLVWS